MTIAARAALFSAARSGTAADHTPRPERGSASVSAMADETSDESRREGRPRAARRRGDDRDVDRRRNADRLHGEREVARAAQEGEAGGGDLLGLVRRRRRRRRPAGDVRLQRRPGCVVRLPPPRRRRPAAGRVPGRRHAPADAASPRAERGVVARLHRSRVRRPGGNGVQPHHRGRPKKDDSSDDKKKDDATDPKEYFGYKRDLESLCEFMGRWLSEHDRWGSPVFIAGESYGGYRVGRLVRMLQETAGIGLERGDPDLARARDLDARLRATTTFSRGSTCCRRWLQLPRITDARACSPPERALDDVLREAEMFATGDYTAFLTRGASMPAAERERILATARRSRRAPRRTWSPAPRAASRSASFTRELLRDERKVLGLYDATITVTDPFPDRESFAGPDPTLSGISPAYTMAINRQLRSEIGVDTDREYTRPELRGERSLDGTTRSSISSCRPSARQTTSVTACRSTRT